LLEKLVFAWGLSRMPEDAGGLQRIGLALVAYRTAHGLELPPDLEALLPCLNDPAAFVAPGDTAAAERGSLRLKYSYEYVGRVPARLAPGTIVCYTRKGLGERRRVLSADGSVREVFEDVLHSPAAPLNSSLTASLHAVEAAYAGAMSAERKAELERFYEVQ